MRFVARRAELAASFERPGHLHGQPIGQNVLIGQLVPVKQHGGLVHCERGTHDHLVVLQRERRPRPQIHCSLHWA